MNDINDLRLEIDEIDQRLLDLIIERFRLVKKIGRIKNENKVGIIDKKREEKIFKNLKNQANKKGLDSENIEKIWRVLMEISYEVEEADNGNG